MIPDWLQVMALSAAPITEYQLAIPVAITQYHFSLPIAYFLGVIGALIPFLPLYFGFEFVRRHLTTIFPALITPFDRLIARADKKLRGNYEKYGAIALFLALVVPFPLTGVWTMTLAAVTLKIPFRAAVVGIFCGLLCGAGFVTLVSAGIINVF